MLLQRTQTLMGWPHGLHGPPHHPPRRMGRISGRFGCWPHLQPGMTLARKLPRPLLTSPRRHLVCLTWRMTQPCPSERSPR